MDIEGYRLAMLRLAKKLDEDWEAAKKKKGRPAVDDRAAILFMHQHYELQGETNVRNLIRKAINAGLVDFGYVSESSAIQRLERAWARLRLPKPKRPRRRFIDIFED